MTHAHIPLQIEGRLAARAGHSSSSKVDLLANRLCTSATSPTR